MKSDVILAKERFKSYLLLFFGFGVAIIVPEIMAGIPDKTIIFRKFDLWWPLLTSIFTWAKKWPKWLRTGSLRAVDRRIARPSSFPSFRVRGGVILPPPPWRRWLRPPPGRGLKVPNVTINNEYYLAWHVHIHHRYSQVTNIRCAPGGEFRLTRHQLWRHRSRVLGPGLWYFRQDVKRMCGKV